MRSTTHPAGHVLGSAQVRLEHGGAVWVVSGDYKTEADPTCPPFEPQACHVFVTESTFGLPIYRWQAPEDTYHEIAAWWRANADAGRASLLYCYAFGNLPGRVPRRLRFAERRTPRDRRRAAADASRR